MTLSPVFSIDGNLWGNQMIIKKSSVLHCGGAPFPRMMGVGAPSNFPSWVKLGTLAYFSCLQLKSDLGLIKLPSHAYAQYRIQRIGIMAAA